MKCNGCETQGSPGPEILPGDDPFDKLVGYEDIKGPLLFEINGEHFCFPCQYKLTNTCYQCNTDVDTLYRDKRCKSNTYVCEVCLKKPATNHLWVCYGNGCLTPGEVAQQEWEIMKMDSEV